jgi:predicted transcriptional regulator YdeE
MSESQVEIREFGPCRIVGMTYVGKNENNEVPQLWEQKLMPRWKEIEAPERPSAFGICRCLPGAVDGTVEYVAAIEATPGAATPEGMVALEVPKCEYVVIPVAGLGEIRQAWAAVPAKLAEYPDREAFCGPAGCECATHPCFEYYPPDFESSGRLSLYIPVKSKGA